jgi:hypothetical protein
MNERINELIKSTNYWYAETNSKADWRLLNGVGEMEWNQKFAELIVQECAAEADKCAERGSWMAGYRIKQHFGVE